VARWELGTFSSDGIRVDGIEVVKEKRKKRCKDAVEKQCDGGPIYEREKVGSPIDSDSKPEIRAGPSRSASTFSTSPFQLHFMIFICVVHRAAFLRLKREGATPKRWDPSPPLYPSLPTRLAHDIRSRSGFFFLSVQKRDVKPRPRLVR
jgi:hypothetical protein